ncbi:MULTISPECIES: hypothetical protein [Ferrimicrobium]|jgi:hypothetical protein|uniref:hypothetical protein n=1 Tax=Ferrimicrobium TaxID=121038 RepID=UPI002633A5C1|nr:hypothetical protein [Ferrimicrobium sp.]MCL5973190.1 hypothetical protein [Actinomycetota bacterium]
MTIATIGGHNKKGKVSSLRRLLGNLLLSLGILAGTIAILAHLCLLTIFNPNRLANDAQTLSASPTIQSAIADGLTNALAPITGVSGIVVSHAELQSIVAAAMRQPQVRDQFVSAIRQADGHLLGTNQAPVTIGGPGLTQFIAAGISQYSSSLGNAVQQTNLRIAIPGADLPNLGPLARAARIAVPIATDAAIVLFLLALIIHKARSAVIARIGKWLIAMSIVAVLIFWALPTYLLPKIHLSWALLASVILKATGQGVTVFYLELAVSGVILYLLSKIATKLV